MSQNNVVLGHVKAFLNTLRTQWWLCVGPVGVFTLLALAYALVMGRSWSASQAIMVRDKVVASSVTHGEFTTFERLKQFQETILEVARSRAAVIGSLKRLGPPPDYQATAGKTWPTDPDIIELRDSISVGAPSGAEFGKTEVIYLTVQGKTKEIALARTNAVFAELCEHFGKLQSSREGSIVIELERTLKVAESELQVATDKLAAFERNIGSDLGALRSLNSNGNDNLLVSVLNQVEVERRQLESARLSLMQLRDLLQTSKDNADAFLATPNRLLEAQPSLRTLKDALIDKQKETASLRGSMSDQHPKVIAALRAEQIMHESLHAEIRSSLNGIDADLRDKANQEASLTAKRDEIKGRLERLAGVLAEYNNLVAQVESCSKPVDEARHKLAEAQAAQSAATQGTQLTRFQNPVISDRPLGPGRTTIVLGGFAGGLSLGMGLIFLFMPLGPDQHGRRLSDYIGFGRRSSDQSGKPRETTRSATVANAATAPTEARGRRNEDAARIPVPIDAKKVATASDNDRSSDRRGGDRRR